MNTQYKEQYNEIGEALEDAQQLIKNLRRKSDAKGYDGFIADSHIDLLQQLIRVYRNLSR